MARTGTLTGFVGKEPNTHDYGRYAWGSYIPISGTNGAAYTFS